MIQIKPTIVKFLADLTTPVSLFLKLREHFPQILLLESSDYSSKEDSLSFICFDSIADIKYSDQIFTITNRLNYQTTQLCDINSGEAIETFLSNFNVINDEKTDRFNGVFGYTTFDMVQDFESIRFDHQKEETNIPLLKYDFFRFIIVFDHYFEAIYILENLPEDEPSGIQKVFNIISRQDHQTYDFSLKNEMRSNMTDEYFLNMVEKAKVHCQRGDIFQIVLSRRFEQEFTGDEFNVYRALRTVNPSPYLFYFDYTDFKIFGSSPEAQILIKENRAEVHPIAGTYKRTGNLVEDLASANRLLDDPKENAEHIMLVDLARNDLSKNCSEVNVDKYREIQYFSHVIHLVSKVTGIIDPGVSSFQILADTFPAGTLSGAPKHMALNLIEKYEPTRRGYYGGTLGMIKFNGELNHAIMIRSFLSQNQKLYFQAGAGIVIDSSPANELEEVNNKLQALKIALLNTKELVKQL